MEPPFLLQPFTVLVDVVIELIVRVPACLQVVQHLVQLLGVHQLPADVRVLVLQLSLERDLYQPSFIWRLRQHGEGVGHALWSHGDVDHLVLQLSPPRLRLQHHLLEQDPPSYHVPLQLSQLHLLIYYWRLLEPVFCTHWWHLSL